MGEGKRTRDDWKCFSFNNKKQMEMIWSGKSHCTSAKSFVYWLSDLHTAGATGSLNCIPLGLSFCSCSCLLLSTRNMVIIKLARKHENKRLSGRRSKSPLTFNSVKIWGQICPVSFSEEESDINFSLLERKPIWGIMNVTPCLGLKFKSFQACNY